MNIWRVRLRVGLTAVCTMLSNGEKENTEGLKPSVFLCSILVARPGLNVFNPYLLDEIDG